MLRFLLWRLLGLLAVLLGIVMAAWLLHGGPGQALRGGATDGVFHHHAAFAIPSTLQGAAHAAWWWAPAASGPLVGTRPVPLLCLLSIAVTVALGALRWHARHRRRYVRLRVEVYRTDHASAEAVVAMFDALHKRLLARWWRRLLQGQPSLALEVHHHACGQHRSRQRSRDARFPRDPSAGVQPIASEDRSPVDDAHSAWLAVSCPVGLEATIETAIRNAYPNCRLRLDGQFHGVPPAVLRLKKQAGFIRRAKALDHFEHERQPPMDRLMNVMGACASPAFVQLAMIPVPALFERYAKRLYKRHEARLSRERREHLVARDRSLVDDVELQGGLEVQHRPLFFTDLRVIAPERSICERIAAELRAESAENRLVERGTTLRHGLFGVYARRVRRGEGNPIPSFHKGVFASTELAALWQLPSIDYTTVPFARMGLPFAPAPPMILRPQEGTGTLRDALGAVSIHPELRKQNTAVPGTVEQGKPNYFDVSIYGGASDSVGRYMRKGSRVAIDGRLEWREWETADLQKRQAVSVVADAVQFLDSPGDRPAGREEDDPSGDGDDGLDEARELVGAGVGADDDLVF